ncbi:MAG TPA: hypothetical protein PLF59_08165 [Cyclobacteriaceae bacterium]|nr:hypothetical protein [Cyclobacteriaceae bacterium]
MNGRFYLVVKTDFRDYRKGDRITDDAVINDILATHEAAMVIKVLRKPGV